MKEFVIGYDAREMWLPTDPEWHRKCSLRDNVIKPLSVDRLCWKSLFRSSISVFTGENIVTGTVPTVPDVEPPVEYRAFWFSYWANLNALQKYLIASWKNSLEPCWLIAISGFDDEHKIGYDVEPVEIDPEWHFLGYDVAESITDWSKLSGFVHEGEEAEWLKNQFAEYINQQHLFTTYEVADEFRHWADQRDRGHSPNYVYGLYHVDTFPKLKQATP